MRSAVWATVGVFALVFALTRAASAGLGIGDSEFEIDGAPALRLANYARFQRCFTGGELADISPICLTLDHPTPDQDVDLIDFCRFHAMYFGTLVDFDADAIPDRCDECPQDPLNDDDGDDVCGGIDACPHTVAGKAVDLAGCPLCGNGLIDPAEECEPPATSQCDDDCLVILAGKIVADECADATPLAIEGTFRFQNRAATTDGPPHTACVHRHEDQIEHDLWACWTAPCDGTIFVRTCFGTDVDTRIAVYAGCVCPVGDDNLLACNDDGCGAQMTQSLATFEAQTGGSYLIRVGTFPGETGGLGALEITCGTEHCPDAGECLKEHASPGCGVESCCEAVCGLDPFCCSSRWDDRCAASATGVCTGGFPACRSSFESCKSPGGHSLPGCDVTECCEAICRVDPFCCTRSWDQACAAREPELCHSACAPGRGSCFTGRASPGCEDDACCSEVCPRDPYCCSTSWDAGCVGLALQHCK